MSAPLPIERLKRLAVGDPEPGDTAWFAEQFEDYEKRAPHGARLDELLGLVPGPGEAPWWKSGRLPQRDHWLRNAAGYLPGLSGRSLAVELLRQIRSYRKVRWHNDAGRGLASHHVGTMRECLFSLLELERQGIALPGERRLRDILSGQ